MKRLYQRNENIIIRKLGKNQWALDMETGSEYGLNEISFDMLNILSAPHSVDELLNEIINVYNVSRDALVEDCNTWLETALQKGLVDVYNNEQ
ncbi:MAG: PqqD family protein [Dysgonamonadaceae bacterium]|nr:PqqD family protein [Dysgonamonadaceae bacterium]